MNTTTSHFNNSFTESNIVNVDSNSSLNENHIKYIKVREDNHKKLDEEDKLSQFSGFSYNKDLQHGDGCHSYNYNYDVDSDILEQNIDADMQSVVDSDLDSDLDFIFDYDIIYNHENNNDVDNLIEIKSKIVNKIKLNNNDLTRIQYTNEGTKFEIIKLFNHYL